MGMFHFWIYFQRHMIHMIPDDCFSWENYNVDGIYFKHDTYLLTIERVISNGAWECKLYHGDILEFSCTSHLRFSMQVYSYFKESIRIGTYQNGKKLDCVRIYILNDDPLYNSIFRK